MPIKHILIVLLSALLLSSCATVPTDNQLPQNNTQTWNTRAKTLSSVKNWDLKALIAIKNNVNKEDLTANLQWQQSQKNYTILMFGPMGVGAIKLTGQPGSVKLETANGKIFNAPSPEALLTQQAGINLPVSNLYYWVRGLPVPHMPSHAQFDSYHHLTELQQEGWQIQYLRYTSVDHIDVPSKIFIFSPQLNVKIVIKEWKI